MTVSLRTNCDITFSFKKSFGGGGGGGGRVSKAQNYILYSIMLFVAISHLASSD